MKDAMESRFAKSKVSVLAIICFNIPDSVISRLTFDVDELRRSRNLDVRLLPPIVGKGTSSD